MTDKDKKHNNNRDNGELLEHEYEILESSENRRPKRLRVKENKSKKSSSDLFEGIVIECHTNNHYLVKVDDKEYLCPLSGRFKNVDFANSRSIVTVGDYVKIDLSSNPRIEEISERTNVLKRYINTHKNRELEVNLAANIDQVIITASYKNPQLNMNLIDRYICSAEMTDVTPIICITKVDLIPSDKNGFSAEHQKLRRDLQYYENCGYKVLPVSSQTGEGMDELKKILKDRNTIFSGLSGTGKTTLINSLEPSLNLRTGKVSESTLKGKHTTSNSKMYAWSFGGYLIDTPGIKTFGLAKEAKDLIPKIFPGFNRWFTYCRFSSCLHTIEQDCKILKELEKGNLPPERYQSYLNIMEILGNPVDIVET